MPDTFWLNFVNIALGLVTLGCLIIVVVGVGSELAHRFHRGAADQDDHVLVTRELGLTMTDGGERLDRTRNAGRKETDA